MFLALFSSCLILHGPIIHASILLLKIDVNYREDISLYHTQQLKSGMVTADIYTERQTNKHVKHVKHVKPCKTYKAAFSGYYKAIGRVLDNYYGMNVINV